MKARLEERAARIEDLQRALTVLTAAPACGAIAAPVIPASASAPAEAGQSVHGSGVGRRRRWWLGRD